MSRVGTPPVGQAPPESVPYKTYSRGPPRSYASLWPSGPSRNQHRNPYDNPTGSVLDHPGDAQRTIPTINRVFTDGGPRTLHSSQREVASLFGRSVEDCFNDSFSSLRSRRRRPKTPPLTPDDARSQGSSTQPPPSPQPPVFSTNNGSGLDTLADAVQIVQAREKSPQPHGWDSAEESLISATRGMELEMPRASSPPSPAPRSPHQPSVRPPEHVRSPLASSSPFHPRAPAKRKDADNHFQLPPKEVLGTEHAPLPAPRTTQIEKLASKPLSARGVPMAKPIQPSQVAAALAGTSPSVPSTSASGSRPARRAARATATTQVQALQQQENNHPQPLDQPLDQQSDQSSPVSPSEQENYVAKTAPQHGRQKKATTTRSRPKQQGPFKCDQCPEEFTRNFDRMRHVKSRHESQTRDKMLQRTCPCCFEVMSRKDAFKRHLKIVPASCKKARSIRGKPPPVEAPESLYEQCRALKPPLAVLPPGFVLGS
ncbi:unnamed protein product [Cyclocybe aegerita]|uniref:C2H2-type domain-containing protein n=1 Tax=Cyclocybe aegerita TaxID=1973307 RepID=A0A8S0VW82_CYCAE|nr:unnamed protein product [Cyclocybe aegerita]